MAVESGNDHLRTLGFDRPQRSKHGANPGLKQCLLEAEDIVAGELLRPAGEGALSRITGAKYSDFGRDLEFGDIHTVELRSIQQQSRLHRLIWALENTDAMR